MSATDKFASLRYRDFRLLWVGLLVSNIGSQMQFAAINWHIYTLTHSAVALGLVGLSRFLPIALFALIGGNVADARNRKKVLIVTQTTLTLLSVLLAYFTFAHRISPLIIYGITALSAVALAFDTPPRQAMVPNLVRKEHIANAMSLNVIMWQVSTVVGPAIAGFIIGAFGTGVVYALNAVSFLAVISALLLMIHAGDVEGTPIRVSAHSMLEGLRFVRSKAMIWSTMLLDFISTFFSSATSLLPIYAHSILHVGPVGYGILYAAPSLGAVIAGYGVAHIGKLSNQGRILLFAIGIYGLATILFGISVNVLLSFLALLLSGMGDSVSTIIRNTIRNFATPDAVRGRMTAVNMIFFLGGPQLGEFEAGVLAAAVGTPLSVVIGGVGTILAVIVLGATIPVLRNYSDENSL